MTLIYCYIACGLALYVLFEQGGGFEAYAALNPSAPRSALVLGLTIGFVLWPIAVALVLLEGGK